MCMQPGDGVCLLWPIKLRELVEVLDVARKPCYAGLSPSWPQKEWVWVIAGDW